MDLICVMEESLSLTFPPPSLKFLSITRTAIHIVNLAIHSDIKNATFGIWLLHECETTISDKMSLLVLPSDWKETLDCLIDEICAKINFWCKWLGGICGRFQTSLLKDIYKHIRVNQFGCVDKLKSAQNIIADDNFDATFRFRIACMYCLEDSIYELASQARFDLVDGFKEDQLISYWRYLILDATEELRHLFVLYDNGTPVKSRAFKFSISQCNELAARCLFEKCSESERIAGFNLFSFEDSSPSSKFLFFSLLNWEQLNIILRKYGCLPLFECISHRPELGVFVRTYKRLSAYIDEKSFLEILLKLSSSPLVTSIDGDEKARIFDMVWEEAPLDYKNHVLNGPGIVKLTNALHEYKNYSNLWNLLKYQNSDQRRLLCEELINLCEPTRDWYFEKRGFERSHLQIIKTHCLKLVKSTDEFNYLKNISSWYLRLEDWKHFIESFERYFEALNKAAKRKPFSTLEHEKCSKRPV